MRMQYRPGLFHLKPEEPGRFYRSIKDAFEQARIPRREHVNGVEITKPFASPSDWRDRWIYFLMVDRFNNPAGPPRPENLPFDAKFGGFRGGTLQGIREKLGYMESLGAGIIWITPVFQNPVWQDSAYHGYGFQEPAEDRPALRH